MTSTVDADFLRNLRRLSVVEGCSTLLLFAVAMPLKYVAEMPLAVTIVGSLHGLLFVTLVGMFAMGVDRIPISRRLASAGVFGAIVPFGPFVVDRWLAEFAGPTRDSHS